MLYRRCFQHLYNIERKRIVTPTNVVMRLNRGEYPEPLPEELRRQIRVKLRTKEIQQYPSYPEFYEKLSHHIGFPTEQICVGAGIEEFIRTLMFLCCDPGEVAAVTWPTCAMYEIYAKAFRVALNRIWTAPGQAMGWEELTQYSYNPRLLFVPNPGQPVETYFNRDQLRMVAKWAHERDIVLAIDEAHYGFGALTALPLVRDFDNVLVLRTFSKFFAGAAIRVGYAVGQERVIKPLHAVRPSGEITGPSITIASMLLDNINIFEERAIETAKARDWLRNKIPQDLGLRAWGHYGFSVLIEFDSCNTVLRVADLLADQGVYVKAGFPAPVEKCMLVACGSPALMERFYEHLRIAMVNIELMSHDEGLPVWS